MNKKTQSLKNLTDFKKLFDDIGLLFWLDDMTLLGAWRDNEFNDSNCISLGSWSNYLLFRKNIKEKAVEMGFDVYSELKYKLSFIRNGVMINLFFYSKNGDKAFYCSDIKNKASYYYVPAKFFETLDCITFYGDDYLRPLDINGYLNYKYKGWQDPK